MFLPDNIDFEKPEKYALTIRISSSIFSFFIREKRSGGECCYRETNLKKDIDLLADIQQIIFDNNFLTLAFDETNVVVVSKAYELIPSYLLESNKIKPLFNFTHNIKSDKVLSATTIIQDNITLFSVDDELYKFVARSLFNPQFYHHTTSVLKYIEDNKSLLNNGISSLVLYFHDGYLDLFLYDQTLNLKYNMTFENETETNLFYYIMNIWDKADLDQLNDYLYVFDSARNQNKNLINLFKEYINHVEIEELRHTFLPIINIEDPQIPIDLLIRELK